MTDRRTTPANARVAAAHLENAAPGLTRTAPEPCTVIRPVVDLLTDPGGARDRQLIWGETVDRYENRQGWSFVQTRKDGYVGYVPSDTLGPRKPATHWVSAPASHVYEAPDIKSKDRLSLSFGSRLTALRETGMFVETDAGFVPLVHVCPAGQGFGDPVAVAKLFLGTPYLWGGNSRTGIDCSGLIQASLLACGIQCPGDSDLQQSVLGSGVPADQPAMRGDLLFWAGHVAMVAEDDRLIHANAHHMAVAFEPRQAAIQRIAEQNGGSVTAHKRL